MAYFYSLVTAGLSALSFQTPGSLPTSKMPITAETIINRFIWPDDCQFTSGLVPGVRLYTEDILSCVIRAMNDEQLKMANSRLDEMIVQSDEWQPPVPLTTEQLHDRKIRVEIRPLSALSSHCHQMPIFWGSRSPTSDDEEVIPERPLVSFLHRVATLQYHAMNKMTGSNDSLRSSGSSPRLLSGIYGTSPQRRGSTGSPPGSPHPRTRRPSVAPSLPTISDIEELLEDNERSYYNTYFRNGRLSIVDHPLAVVDFLYFFVKSNSFFADEDCSAEWVQVESSDSFGRSPPSEGLSSMGRGRSGSGLDGRGRSGSGLGLDGRGRSSSGRFQGSPSTYSGGD